MNNESCQWTTLDIFQENPINKAHALDRKAERYVESGNWEDALKCYDQANKYISKAMEQTSALKVLQTLQLQFDSHMDKKRIINIKRSESSQKNVLTSVHHEFELDLEELSCDEMESAPALTRKTEMEENLKKRSPTEQDSLLQFLNSSASRLSPNQKKYPKAPLDVVEELQITNKNLSRLVEKIVCENEELKNANNDLLQQNTELSEELQLVKQELHMLLKSRESPTSGLNFFTKSTIAKINSVGDEEKAFKFKDNQTVTYHINNAMKEHDHTYPFYSELESDFSLQ